MWLTQWKESAVLCHFSKTVLYTLTPPGPNFKIAIMAEKPHGWKTDFHLRAVISGENVFVFQTWRAILHLFLYQLFWKEPNDIPSLLKA